MTRFRGLTRTAAAACAAAALAAGCSGAPSQTAGAYAPSASSLHPSAATYRPMVDARGVMSQLPQGFAPNGLRRLWLRPAPDAVKTSVAVAQFGGSSVLWFDKINNKKNAPPTTCEPAQSTNGIRVDRGRNLWVPNGVTDTVTEYAPNCGAAELTIDDSTGEPADIGFDRSNNVYVLNINDHSGPPTVEVYDKTGKHERTLSDSSFASLFGVNSDQQGDVFVSNLTSQNDGTVVEFPKGKMPGTVLSGINLGLPGVPAFDSKGNLIITDWEALTLDVFAPPYTGSPTTSPIEGSSIWCPLGPKENRVYCGDADNGSIDVFKYPGGKYLYSYTADLSPSALVTGVAPSPAWGYWK
jgi:hypothetical protein